jgi:hypothetical protein
MASNGRLLNRPSDPGGERRVGESLLVFYYGVYAPPVAVPVLSPNGDGIADRQVLRYKLVEPAAVDAKLVDPAGVPHFEQTDARPPGTYRLVWNGLAEGGSPGLEGRWRWVVTATDDAGRESSVERVFSLNRTLVALRLRPTPFALRRARPLRVTFSLAHAARVRVTVETRSGEVVRTLVRGPRAAGSVSLSWPSRGARRSLRSFRDYVLRVSASNALGRVDLTRQLRVSAR